MQQNSKRNSNYRLNQQRNSEELASARQIHESIYLYVDQIGNFC